MRDYYIGIVSLYERSETDEVFAKAYSKFVKKYDEIILSEPSKMKINNIDDLKVILKAIYCMELPLLEVWTPFNNAHYIAGDISKEIILGRFKFRTLTPKQKNVFENSKMYVDFSNLENYDLRRIYIPGFIKNENISFF